MVKMIEPPASDVQIATGEPHGQGIPVCTTREAAELLGVSLRTVQLWVDSGVLQAWKTAGGHRRVSRQSIDALRNGQSPAQPIASLAVAPEDHFSLGYQPIIDASGRIFGYELLYRNKDELSARFDDPVQATAQVIRVAFGELGFLGAIGDALCFVNVDDELLHADILLALEPSKIVLELSAETPSTPRLIERCTILKEAGYRFLIENYRPGVDISPLAEIADFIKFDLRDGLNGVAAASALRKPTNSLKLIGGRLETEAAYETAKQLGCDYFQGFYIAHPTINRGQKIPSQKVALLDLLRLVHAHNTDNTEIERRLKLDPALCFNLLKLVNSAAGGSSRRVGSLREVLLVLGRQTLCRWLQILLFSDEEHLTDTPHPLMQLAAFRGRFLEHLVTLIPGGIGLKDKDFMVGLLSCLEALLRVPLEQILSHLSLTDDVQSALLRRQGTLGQLLLLVEALADQDFDKTDEIVDQFSLNWSLISRGMVESLSWSNALNRSSY